MNKKFIAWGLPLHSHTHSYIHSAYCKAFKYLGYNVFHFDDNDDVSNFDFSDSIILTAGICDNNIPLIKNAKYILHNCDISKYKDLNYLILQVYTNDLEEGSNRYIEEDMEKIDYTIYYSKKSNVLYQPWATDLLPFEIDTNYYHNSNKQCVWVGSVWGGEHGNHSELIPFIETCSKYGYKWRNFNPGQCSFELNKELVFNSEIAPSINGEWQKNKHYIPCRIFKNISYGKVGITNNLAVKQLLEDNVLYGPSSELMDNYLKAYYSNNLYGLFTKSCKLIKEKHTYINRINTILKFL